MTTPAYYLLSPLTPKVIAVVPNTGQDGTPIAVRGAGFTGATAVYFSSPAYGDVAASSFTVMSDNEIDAVTPHLVNSAITQITVVTPVGTSSALPWVQTGAGQESLGTVYAHNGSGVGPPAITGVSPTSGTSLGGTSITITGSGFNSGVLDVELFMGDPTDPLYFVPVPVTSFTVVDDTTMTAVTPPNPYTVSPGGLYIMVVGAGSLGAGYSITSSVTFTYT